MGGARERNESELSVTATEWEGIFPGLAGLPRVLDSVYDPVNMIRVVDLGPSAALHLIESRAREFIPAPVEPEEPTARIHRRMLDLSAADKGALCDLPSETLEWATRSPPPAYDFDRLRDIRSKRSVLDACHAHVSLPPLLGLATASSRVIHGDCCRLITAGVKVQQVPAASIRPLG